MGAVDHTEAAPTAEDPMAGGHMEGGPMGAVDHMEAAAHMGEVMATLAMAVVRILEVQAFMVIRQYRQATGFAVPPPVPRICVEE